MCVCVHVWLCVCVCEIEKEGEKTRERFLIHLMKRLKLSELTHIHTHIHTRACTLVKTHTYSSRIWGSGERDMCVNFGLVTFYVQLQLVSLLLQLEIQDSFSPQEVNRQPSVPYFWNQISDIWEQNFNCSILKRTFSRGKSFVCCALFLNTTNLMFDVYLNYSYSFSNNVY